MPGKLALSVLLVWACITTNNKIETFSMKDESAFSEEVRQITECISTSSDTGAHSISSLPTNGSVCSLYLFSPPTTSIVFSLLNITRMCDTLADVGIFDGWIMQGEVFPSEAEHAKSLTERAVSLCGAGDPRGKYISSQNTLTLQFSAHSASSLVFEVHHVQNPDFCHQLATEEDEYVLVNRGRERNCTLLVMGLGFSYHVRSLFSADLRDFVFKRIAAEPRMKLDQVDDFLEMGTTDSLSTNRADTTRFIGMSNLDEASKGVQCFQMLYFRLVSSGRYYNHARLLVHTFTPAELAAVCL